MKQLLRLPFSALVTACAIAMMSQGVWAHGMEVVHASPAGDFRTVSMHQSFVPPITEQVVAQAKSCLTLSGAASRGSYRAELAVIFESGIAAEIRIAEIDPPGRIGQSIGDAASRAVQRCGPYSGVEDGTMTLVFESEE